jgi:pyridoxal phosphate enzyme (YggS family)
LNVADRIGVVRSGMAAAAVAAGRDPGEIELLAASKAQPAEAIRAAYDAGQRLFGESYVQEWRAKAEHRLLVGLPDLRWHFIGSLQRNKVRFLLGRVACIESVGKRSLAHEIARRSEAGGRTTDVLLSVNIGREPSKSGFLPDDLEAACAELIKLPGIRVRGLMSIPPPRPDAAATRADHAALTRLQDGLRERLSIELPTLSMGMSGDYAQAIAEGSTRIRIGTAVFGARPPRR